MDALVTQTGMREMKMTRATMRYEILESVLAEHASEMTQWPAIRPRLDQREKERERERGCVEWKVNGRSVCVCVCAAMVWCPRVLGPLGPNTINKQRVESLPRTEPSCSRTKFDLIIHGGDLISLSISVPPKHLEWSMIGSEAQLA